MDLIIGAGITGLSYARYCGHDDYLILEKNDHIGGYCNTIYKDDFVWDYSGHFFHFRDKHLKEELYKNFNSEDILTIKKHTQIEYNGRKIDFPFQQNIHQLPKNEFIECLYDFYFRKDFEYKSFKQMIESRFGKSICDKFLIPYNEKLYACDLNDLDHNAMGRFFPYVTLDDIIGNFKEKTTVSYNVEFTYHKRGAFKYVEAIFEEVDKRKCFLNEEVLNIDMNKKIVNTDKRDIEFDNVISTIPFNELLKRCAIKNDKRIYTWNKVLVFNLGFDSQSTDTVNHWIYVPSKEYSFYRVGFYSNILNQNKMSLYIEVSFSYDTDVNIEDTKFKVMKDLKKMGIITNQRLIAEHSIILNPAYVHINERMNKDKEEKMEYLNTKQILD